MFLIDFLHNFFPKSTEGFANYHHENLESWWWLILSKHLILSQTYFYLYLCKYWICMKSKERKKCTFMLMLILILLHCKWKCLSVIYIIFYRIIGLMTRHVDYQVNSSWPESIQYIFILIFFKNNILNIYFESNHVFTACLNCYWTQVDQIILN